MPIFYECDRCTACCRWPGQVKVSPAEITRLAAFLQMDESDFIQQFTRLNATRTGLALRNQSNGACVFLDGIDCKVNAVKPQQCRDFPNLWSFQNFQQVCRAKPREVTPEDWKRLVRLATGREAEPHATA